MATGDEGVQMMMEVERAGVTLSPGTFRPMEAIYDPADYGTVLQRLQQGEHRITSTRIREVVQSVVFERWWLWTLCHPDLKDSDIHPSRRVLQCCTAVINGKKIIVLVNSLFVSLYYGNMDKTEALHSFSQLRNTPLCRDDGGDEQLDQQLAVQDRHSPSNGTSGMEMDRDKSVATH